MVGNAISGSEYAAARFFVTGAVSRKDAIETDDGAFLAGIDGGGSEVDRVIDPASPIRRDRGFLSVSAVSSNR